METDTDAGIGASNSAAVLERLGEETLFLLGEVLAVDRERMEVDVVLETLEEGMLSLLGETLAERERVEFALVAALREILVERLGDLDEMGNSRVLQSVS